jgi:hypothetical protein
MTKAPPPPVPLRRQRGRTRLRRAGKAPMTNECPRAKSTGKCLLFGEKLRWDLVRKLEWRGFLMRRSEKFSGRFEGSRFQGLKVREKRSLHFPVCQLRVVRCRWWEKRAGCGIETGAPGMYKVSRGRGLQVSKSETRDLVSYRDGWTHLRG